MARFLDRALGGGDDVGSARKLRGGNPLLSLRHRSLIAVMLGDRVVELRPCDPAFIVELLDSLEIGD